MGSVFTAPLPPARPPPNPTKTAIPSVLRATRGGAGFYDLRQENAAEHLLRSLRVGAWAPSPNYMSQRASLSRKTFFPGPGQRVGTAAGAGKVWDPGGLFTCVRTGSPSPFLAPADGGRDWGFGGAAALGGASLWAEPGVCSGPARRRGRPSLRGGSGLCGTGGPRRLIAADELSVSGPSGPLTWSWDCCSCPPARAPRSALFLLFLFLLQPTHTQFRQRSCEVVRVPWIGDCVWFLCWRRSLVLRHYEPEL